MKIDNYDTQRETFLPLTSPMTVYDLCFAWEWIYDQDFAHLLDSVCTSQGISLLQVTPDNLDQVLTALNRQEIAFRALLDRASDSIERFIELVRWAGRQNLMQFNRHRMARRAWNKAYCHQCFTNVGLPTPPTIAIPSYIQEPDLLPVDMLLLGSTFYIKPAHGGGGRGVIIRASSWEQVVKARQEYPNDQYLLQAAVTPAEIDGRQAWFRVLYCAGAIYTCWWDTHTHIYTPLIPNERTQSLYQQLQTIMATISQVCKLEIFSSEIAYTYNGNCVIVDYLNDPVDLRVQSKAIDGVPDEIVNAIAQRIAGLVASRMRVF